MGQLGQLDHSSVLTREGAENRATYHKAHLFGSVFWIFNVYSSVSEPEIDCWVEQLPFLFPNKAQVFLKKVYNSVIFS